MGCLHSRFDHQGKLLWKYLRTCHLPVLELSLFSAFESCCTIRCKSLCEKLMRALLLLGLKPQNYKTIDWKPKYSEKYLIEM